MANTSDINHHGLMKGQTSFLIYYEDTDLSGFVYHANYLKYFERAREHIIGVKFLAELYEKGLHFVVSKANLQFLAPTGHGEEVIIRSEGAYSKSPAIHFKQNAFKADPKGNAFEVLACSGDVTIVILNRENRPVRMPDELLEYFSNR